MGYACNPIPPVASTTITPACTQPRRDGKRLRTTEDSSSIFNYLGNFVEKVDNHGTRKEDFWRREGDSNPR
jgi:hypothetical protein